MPAIGPQVGLCHCPHCQRYSCKWCWADASGDCPECAFPYVATAAAAAAPVALEGRTRSLGRGGTAVMLTFGGLMVVLALVLTLGGGLPLNAGSANPSAPPVGAAGTDTASSTAGAPSVGASGSAIGGVGTPGVTPRPNDTGAAGGGPTTPPVGPAPTPAPTPKGAPTPPPTIAPTPRPTPRPPTPTPTPVPTCKTVPDLVGKTVSSARAAWTAAGFAGAFLPKGHGASIVTGQSQTPGACLPATATMTVTYTNPAPSPTP
jgi:PASTA domain-containing protein